MAPPPWARAGARVDFPAPPADFAVRLVLDPIAIGRRTAGGYVPQGLFFSGEQDPSRKGA
jgi:hypothetical protein